MGYNYINDPRSGAQDFVRAALYLVIIASLTALVLLGFSEAFS